MEYFELSLCTLVGLIFGSFVNVCVDRITLRFAKTKPYLYLLNSNGATSLLKRHIINGSLSIFHPARSFCFSCGYQLKWFENIPVLSYFLCRGICRNCYSLIGSRIIYTEISNGVFYLACMYFFDSWMYALALGICFSFFWFTVSFYYFSRNLEKIILR